MTYDVVVAGLGAMGSATVFHLARRGVRALGLDRYRPPHGLGSSHGGSRVIRETAFEHPRYVPIARRAYDCWREIEAATGARLLEITGGLHVGAPESRLVRGSAESARVHGIPCEELSAAEIRRRYPAFQPDDAMVGLFEPRAGVLAPERCVAACLDFAGRHGVDLRFEEPLVRWDPDGDGVIATTPTGRYRTAALLLSTGPWIQEALAGIGVRVAIERVLQHWFEPLAHADLFQPGRCPVSLWDCAGGVLFAAFPLDDRALKFAVHHQGELTTAEAVNRSVSGEEVAGMRELLIRHLPTANGAHRDSQVCLYTNTPDGDFLIDRHPAHPSVVLASPCSGIGFKFASAIGEGLADLLTGETPGLALAAFRAERFAPANPDTRHPPTA